MDRAVPGAARGDPARLTEEHRGRLEHGAAGELVAELQAWWRPPAARGAVDAADHRAVPGRPAGRRAGRLPSGPAAAGRRARARSRPRAAGAGTADPAPGPAARPARPTAGPGNLPALSALAARPRRRPGRGRRAGRGASAGHPGRSGRGGQDPAGDRGRPQRPAPDGGGWSGWRTPDRPAVWQGVGEAFELGGATEAMVLDRLRGWTCCWCSTTASSWSRPAGPAERMLSAAPGLRVLATSQLRSGVDGEAVVRRWSRWRSPTRSPCSPSGPRSSAGRSAWTRTPAGHRGGVPLARRPAAGHRTGRRAGQGAVGGGDRPAAR